jgi:hypothetical protein
MPLSSPHLCERNLPPPRIDCRPRRVRVVGMKKLLAAMFVALLMVGCGDPDDEENSFGWSDANKPASTGVIDLDDNETLDRVIAEAIDIGKLQGRRKSGEELRYAQNQQTPYMGWAKGSYDNGQIRLLWQLKGGKMNGLVRRWHNNGQKAQEENMRDGKPEGFATEYDEDGQRKTEENYKDGKIVTAVV